MKALLISAYNYSVKEVEDVGYRKRQPLDLLYVSSYLDLNLVDNEVVDAAALHLENDQVMKEIKLHKPDLIIMSTTTADRWECPHVDLSDTFNLIREIKNDNKNCKIILYGSHVTTRPKSIINKIGHSVDIFIKGEPELKVNEIIKYLLGKRGDLQIPGIWYKDDNSFIEVKGDLYEKNLDNLLRPNYKKIEFKNYSYNGDGLQNPFVIMLSSRGCPFQCTFCLRAMSPGYRIMSAQKVVEEIQYLVDNFSVKSIFFQDWEYLIDKNRGLEIAKLLLAKSIKIQYGFNSRVPDMDPNIMSTLKKSGLTRVNFGLESASDQVLKNVNKKITKEQILQAVKICQVNNITAGYYTLINLPGENSESIKETTKFLAKHKIEFRPGTIRYYPGTILGDEVGVDWDDVTSKSGSYKTVYSNRSALNRFHMYYKLYLLIYHPLLFLNKFVSMVKRRFLKNK
jgi:anaerobic magnesium-protoporphyrin IX monomethyl ester cyclase